MKFDIEVDGRLRSVVVERLAGNGRFHVVVDGRTHDLEARPTDLGLSLLFDAGGRSVDAAATPFSGGEWLVQLAHVDVPVVVDRQRHARGGQPTAGGAGQQRVKAPMPGRVLRVLVKPGDTVAHRQGLVVVEAMKMENELTAPKAGTVTDVAVTEGMSVEAGRLLVVIE
ncbi:MAG: biotin/lipoyl-containing protein [Vicinamibacterales bacterium]